HELACDLFNRPQVSPADRSLQDLTLPRIRFEMSSFRSAFCLCLLLFMPVANADELSFFGLADVQPMSDTAGEAVRGAGGVTARTTGSAGLTATILDPDTGSIWNFNVTQFSDTRDIKNHLYEARTEHTRSNAFSDLMIGIGSFDFLRRGVDG
ncbi:hypothetical protein N9D23_15300, partial [Rubripirellula sp.]|nr:hypothetical protein [Rubripirellula sp.]